MLLVNATLNTRVGDKHGNAIAQEIQKSVIYMREDVIIIYAIASRTRVLRGTCREITKDTGTHNRSRPSPNQRPEVSQSQKLKAWNGENKAAQWRKGLH